MFIIIRKYAQISSVN